MKITLKDGSFKEYDKAMSVYEIASDISEGLARMACAGELDGKVVDLRTIVDQDSSLNIVTFNDAAGKAAYRHTTSHVLAQAVKRLYPEAKLAIGPSIDTGFYYDFDLPSLDRAALDALEVEMKKIIKEGADLVRFTLPRAEAIALMQSKNEPYKVELIEDLPVDAELSFYQQGDFVDLCAGPHLMSTKNIKAFKLRILKHLS
ncbi:MAG: thrS [Firmicutes bacterium]|nr:thrS [Bacillota bacterium]